MNFTALIRHGYGSHFYLLTAFVLSSGSVDLRYSEVLYKDLSKGLEGLLLNSFLHLVYLVTPYEIVSQIKPDWMIYFSQVRPSHTMTP